MSKLKKLKLPAWIVIGMILGIIVGLGCMYGMEEGGKFTTANIKPIGTIYINLLKFLVVPVVLTSIVSGVVSLGDVKRMGSIGWKTVVYYLATTAIAIVIGLIFASAAKTIGMFPEAETLTLEEYSRPETKGIMEVLVGIFPENMWKSFSDASMLQVIVVALLMGTGILAAGDAGKKFGDVMESAYAVVMKVMGFVIALTPIGVFCLMADVVAVNGPQIVGSLLIVIGVAYLAYIVHFVVCYGVSASALSKVGFVKFVKGIWPAMVVAFTTTSSNATLPINTECSNKMGADPEVSSFVLPLGATINMDGTAIYMGVATVFIASFYGINLTLSQMAMVVVTAILASVGTAGVSGAGMIMLAMVLESVGLPVEGIGLIYGVDKLFDMGRTTLNIVGDSTCALYMSRLDSKRAARLAAAAKK